MATAQELTKQATAAYHAKNLPDARKLLVEAVQTEPTYAMGWLWLAAVVEKAGEKRYCLDQVLTFDPSNVQARKGLATLPDVPSAAPAELAAEIAPPPDVSLSAAPLPVVQAAPPAQVRSPKTEAHKKGGCGGPTLVILGILAIGFVILAVLGRPTQRGPEAPSAMGAWLDCQNFVKQNLKAPTTAQFPGANAEGVGTVLQDNGRWGVIGYVDSQNSFGAMIRSDYVCELSYNGNQVVAHKLVIGDQVLINSP